MQRKKKVFQKIKKYSKLVKYAKKVIEGEIKNNQI